jgi:flagellar biosynthesis protein FliQ
MIRRYSWALVFLISAILLGAVIAGVLAATLIKSDTVTTLGKILIILLYPH